MTTGKLKSTGVSCYKARRVADLVRGLPVATAEDILARIQSPIAKIFLAVLNSTIANALHNDHMQREALVVSKIIVDQGPKTKRIRPKARGSAGAFNRPSSHITMVLEETRQGT